MILKKLIRLRLLIFVCCARYFSHSYFLSISLFFKHNFCQINKLINCPVLKRAHCLLFSQLFVSLSIFPRQEALRQRNWRALPHCIHQTNLPVHTHTLLMNWWAMFMRNHLPARQITNRCLLAYEQVVEPHWPLLWFQHMKEWNVKVFPDLLARLSTSLCHTLQMSLKGTVHLK